MDWSERDALAGKTSKPASADAYVNEMGITSPLQPDEPTSNGNSVAEFDTVPDPDDEGVDVELFALSTRSGRVTGTN